MKAKPKSRIKTAKVTPKPKASSYAVPREIPMALLWCFRVVAAGILLQTLFFKFTAAPESVYIFDQLGVEPWGRIGSGIAELVVAVLLLVPKLSLFGALSGVVIMSGAILSHLFVLGIAVQGDGGLLFGLAIAVLVCCGLLIWSERRVLVTLLIR